MTQLGTQKRPELFYNPDKKRFLMDLLRTKNTDTKIETFTSYDSQKLKEKHFWDWVC